MFDSGYLTLAKLRGSPIRAHWSLLLGLAFVSGGRFAPGAWAGYILIILLHELGHAALARRYGMHVLEVMLHGMGGHCRYAGALTPWSRAVIATGGVLAQLVILLVALPLSFVAVIGPHTATLFHVLVQTNLLIMVLNLIPFGGLDGAEIIKIPGLWRARRKQREVRDARSKIEPRPPGRRDKLDLGPVNEDEVRETVRRALDEARRRPN